MVADDIPAALSDRRAMHVVIDTDSFAKALAAALAPVLDKSGEAPEHPPNRLRVARMFRDRSIRESLFAPHESGRACLLEILQKRPGLRPRPSAESNGVK